ncbi:hypothetical protein CWC31_11420 [Pseudoalteromonas ruthenica]|uniref:DUF4259 domain-containing protein n=1 Tax=Pseudoalteromonas ruthenica TaxID=151081 RepID=UPI0011084739|nr:DUF4259 domain-containing protein [Pseudoalteromonas ruthenica]TLX50475.1 hypothetical protein CWC31_11420 [Pseudoalteromonas ruthenica]
MGAWGMGIFDDDTSYDLIDEVMEGDAKSFLENASSHKDSGYLEYEECHEVLVSGAILDAISNGTTYGDSVEGFDAWISNQSTALVDSFRPQILEALNLIISEKSELNELWQENEDDYPTWKSNVNKVISRLSS